MQWRIEIKYGNLRTYLSTRPWIVTCQLVICSIHIAGQWVKTIYFYFLKGHTHFRSGWFSMKKMEYRNSTISTYMQLMIGIISIPTRVSLQYSSKIIWANDVKVRISFSQKFALKSKFLINSFVPFQSAPLALQKNRFSILKGWGLFLRI